MPTTFPPVVDQKDFFFSGIDGARNAGADGAEALRTEFRRADALAIKERNIAKPCTICQPTLIAAVNRDSGVNETSASFASSASRAKVSSVFSGEKSYIDDSTGAMATSEVPLLGCFMLKLAITLLFAAVRAHRL